MHACADRRKRATTSLLKLYELEQEPLPCAGDYSVILDSAQRPRCITRITKVTQVRFCDISEEYARRRAKAINPGLLEKAHREAFSRECREECGIEFTEDMICVCEEFEVVYWGESETNSK